MAITTINWPPGLPPAPITLSGEYVRVGKPDNLKVFSVPDTGPPLSRTRSSAFYVPYTIPLIVKTFDEVDIFDDFYLDTLAVGSLPFLWKGWVRRGTEVFLFHPAEPPPVPEEMGNGVHRITLNLLQYPEGAV